MNSLLHISLDSKTLKTDRAQAVREKPVHPLRPPAVAQVQLGKNAAALRFGV